jgi:hypothetical protein
MPGPPVSPDGPVRHLRTREDGADAGDGAGHRQPGRSRGVERMHGFRRGLGRPESLQRLHHDDGSDHLRSVLARLRLAQEVLWAALGPRSPEHLSERWLILPACWAARSKRRRYREGPAIQGRGWSKRPRPSLGALNFLELRYGEVQHSPTPIRPGPPERSALATHPRAFVYADTVPEQRGLG